LLLAGWPVLFHATDLVSPLDDVASRGTVRKMTVLFTVPDNSREEILPKPSQNQRRHSSLQPSKIEQLNLAQASLEPLGHAPD
jgi:hypothetical protein